MERLRIRTGIDLVYVPRLAALLENASFLQRAFQPSELRDMRPEHLAGVFAAKEACFKALGRAPCWLATAVDTQRGQAEAEGKPRLSLSPEIAPPGLLSLDLSISHEGDYAVAVVVMLTREDGSSGEDDQRDRS